MLKKDSLVKGTIILALAAFIARFLGIAQRVPLVYLLGDAGNAPYGFANNLYLALLPIATAGIPSALSKLVAEKTALGEREEAERIFHVAVRFAITAGIVITIPLMIVGPFYARASDQSEAVLSVWAIAPALLLFPLIAMLRGYFQGRQMMTAGGVSQIVEQILRVATAVALAALLVKGGASLEWASAGASFGGVAGAVGALLVMLMYLRRLRREDANDFSGPAEREGRPAAKASPAEIRRVFIGLIKLSIPISLYSATVSLIYLIDSSIGIPLLKGQVGYEQAQELLGTLAGRAQSLAGIPVVFAVAVSQSLVPVISAAYSRGDQGEVRRKASQALQLALLSGLPVVLAITLGAEPINGLLFKDTSGTDIIALLAAGTIFQIMMMTSGAVLMGMGRMKLLLANLLVCVGVKLVFSLLLSAWFGMDGMIVATGLCFLAASAMNFRYLRRTIGFTFLGRRWSGVLITTAVIGLAGYGTDRLNRLVHPFAGGGTLAVKLNYLLRAAEVGVVVLGLYVLLVFATRIITADELAALPGPLRKPALKAARLLGRQNAPSGGS